MPPSAASLRPAGRSTLAQTARTIAATLIPATSHAVFQNPNTGMRNPLNTSAPTHPPTQVDGVEHTQSGPPRALAQKNSRRHNKLKPAQHSGQRGQRRKNHLRRYPRPPGEKKSPDQTGNQQQSRAGNREQ